MRPVLNKQHEQWLRKQKKLNEKLNKKLNKKSHTHTNDDHGGGSGGNRSETKDDRRPFVNGASHPPANEMQRPSITAQEKSNNQIEFQ